MNKGKKTGQGETVMSPSDGREGLEKNCGGMPPMMDVKEIFKENQPPTHQAVNSVTTRGSGDVDED